MMDAEGPVEVAVLGLEQLSVVLVLDPDFLDVGVGETPDGTLHIQHTQETSALKNGQKDKGLSGREDAMIFVDVLYGLPVCP